MNLLSELAPNRAASRPTELAHPSGHHFLLAFRTPESNLVGDRSFNPLAMRSPAVTRPYLVISLCEPGLRLELAQSETGGRLGNAERSRQKTLEGAVSTWLEKRDRTARSSLPAALPPKPGRQLRRGKLQIAKIIASPRIKCPHCAGLVPRVGFAPLSPTDLTYGAHTSDRFEAQQIKRSGLKPR